MKLVSKKGQLEKGIRDFFFFHFWDLKLVPIDSVLNSALENLTYFLKNVSVVPRKAGKLENLG